ncbi:urease accessory protein UreD [Pseudozyma hubeiensis SY62]|uniref:Urease accessory protein UreD n=1 Tax=Pseudozyma hubeiensis (strain SY62) TaxID=1305764 RepID=R9PA19_PSEHS|nr:urease accessory protein UreD [Pseudozyma hubeiensis SY62]GAC98216.1 urease accessory protein UreD [Pseudozyma hubeiensis SY62]
MDFVPLFGMALGAALRSLTYGRLLHQSFFEAKRMSPFQIELWITERQHAYRSFGFVAALMERIPLIGLIFSISNRIGAAMWAHDLEKRQQRIRSSTTSSDATNSIASGIEPSGGGVQLEEFKSKPTLKKIYKNVQQDATQSVEEDGGNDSNFNGEGLAVLRCAKSGRGVFTHLSFTFPLKLMSPVVSSRNATRQTTTMIREVSSEQERQSEGRAGGKVVNAMYVVGYGGGLVSGDSVELDVDVGMGCCLMVLTQGSTKVFKTRVSRPTRGVSTASFTSNRRIAQGEEVKIATRQNFRFLIRPNSTLVLFPDPVTCFANARYDQIQRFDLRHPSTSSCIVLDWITPGRTAVPPPPSQTKRLDHLDSHSSSSTAQHATAKDYSIPPRSAELWEFASYRSRNELRIAGTVVARDTILLSQSENEFFVDPISGQKFTELARRNHPFGCYATLILAGIDAEEVGVRLESEFEKIQQRPTTTLREEEVLWSLSSVEEGRSIHRCSVKKKTMNLLALLLSSISLLLFKSVSASSASPGLNLFYNYDTFCNSPPTSGPSIHYLHICVDSADGPVVQQLDAPGLYSVFSNPSNNSQFVIVLWDPTFNSQVQTKNYLFTMYAGSQLAQPGCAEWYVTDLKDGKWVGPKAYFFPHIVPTLKTTRLSLLLFAALSVAPSIARPAIAPAGLDLFYGWKTFCSDPHAKFPDHTYHLCVGANTGSKADVIDSTGSVSVYINDVDKTKFAIVLWNKDSKATVKTEHTKIDVQPDNDFGNGCVWYDIDGDEGMSMGDICPTDSMVVIPGGNQDGGPDYGPPSSGSDGGPH